MNEQVAHSDPTEPKAAAGIRHELYQPLNRIIGYSEILLEEAKGGPLGTFSADLQKIHTAANTLLALLDSAVVSPKVGSDAPSPTLQKLGDGPPLLEEDTRKEAMTAGPEATARSSGHLLVVDDNETNRDLLSRQLRHQGYQVSVAEDGRRALEWIKTQPVDLVLLDVLMPGMDGFATCKRLKAQPGTQDIPVIFMTALTDTVDKVKGFQLGAVDYITKPFQLAEVLARITTHLALEQLKSRLKESEERLSHIIESAMDAILTIDREGRIILFNRAAERVFRCPANDAIGGHCKRFLSEALCRVLAEHMGAAGSKTSMWVPEGHSALRADGEPFPVEATASYAEANGQALYTLILRDVQERHKTEAERQKLQGLNRYLQEELRVSQAAEASSAPPRTCARCWRRSSRSPRPRLPCSSWGRPAQARN